MPVASPSRTVSSGSGAKFTNLRSFLLLCAWGSGAALAVVVAVAAGRTELGNQRVRAAMNAILSPPQGPDQQMSEQLAALAGEFDKQMRLHTGMVRALTEQRDGLVDKVGVLERQLNELGSTLARTTTRLEGETRSAQQAAAAASAVAASTRMPQPKPDVLKPDVLKPDMLKPDVPESPPAVAGAQVPASPIASPPGRAPAQQVSPLPPGQIHPAAFSAAGIPVTSGRASSEQVYTGAIAPPVVAETSSAAAMRPIHVQRLQLAATADPSGPTHRSRAKAPPPATSVATAPLLQMNPLMTTGIFATPADPDTIAAEFAIDLGAAPTVETLRARWNELRASQSPLLDNLKPLIALKDGTKSGQELHLVAGPLAASSTGIRLCAVLAGSGTVCQPTLFEGQRLAVH
jgi:hypothetical protein